MISYYNPFFDDEIVYSCDNLRLSFEFLSSDSGEHFLSWLSQFEYAYYRSSKPFAYKHLNHLLINICLSLDVKIYLRPAGLALLLALISAASSCFRL